MLISIEVDQKLKEVENDQKIIESHLGFLCPTRLKVPFGKNIDYSSKLRVT